MKAQFRSELIATQRFSQAQGVKGFEARPARDAPRDPSVSSAHTSVPNSKETQFPFACLLGRMPYFGHFHQQFTLKTPNGYFWNRLLNVLFVLRGCGSNEHDYDPK